MCASEGIELLLFLLLLFLKMMGAPTCAIIEINAFFAPHSHFPHLRSCQISTFFSSLLVVYIWKSDATHVAIRIWEKDSGGGRSLSIFCVLRVGGYLMAAATAAVAAMCRGGGGGGGGGGCPACWYRISRRRGMGFDKKCRIYSKTILQFLYSSPLYYPSFFLLKLGKRRWEAMPHFRFSLPSLLQQNYSMGWEEEEEKELEPHPHLPHH